jgi:MFS family permease
VYGLFSPVGGYLADRFNRRWVVIASLGIWSAITWLTGHAQTYDQLWWARALMGFSEACYIPAALALIADFHTRQTRARAVGIHQAGIYAGIILGGMGGFIADSSYGWRAGFQWFGLAGVAYAVVLLFFLRAPSPSSAGPDTQPAFSLGASLRQLLGLGAFVLLVLYFTLPAMPGWVVKSWMPKLLAETFHLGQGIAGVSATLWVTLASLAGVLVGGVLSDLWLRRSPRGRIYVSAIGTALCIPALFGIGYAPSLAVAVLFLVLYGIGFGFFDTNNMPILCQIVSPRLRATGYGLMNMVSVIVGGFAVKQVGVMRDSGSPPSAIFSICALAAALAVVFVLLIRPRQNTELSD